MAEVFGLVVIGRNEGQRLIDCLKSVVQPGRHVVYVDSGSTDGSVTAAEGLGATVHELGPATPFTAARARNEGFLTLKALCPSLAFVQFLDGDCILASDWLSNALEFLGRESDVAIVCGRRRERHPERSIYNELCDIEWDTPVGEAKSCGGDSLVRASAFEAVGGFSSELIAGEEPELCTRLRERGWRVFRLEAEMTLHDAAITGFGQWWRRAMRCGYGYAELAGASDRRGSAVYKREAVKAALWGGLFPAATCLAAIFSPLAIVALAVYPVKVGKVALQRRGRPRPWLYATFVVLAQFPEFLGQSKFWWGKFAGRRTAVTEYKVSTR